MQLSFIGSVECTVECDVADSCVSMLSDSIVTIFWELWVYR